ncbi:carbohydrate-binding domain-containing protein [Humisphaera borealis]|uniref:PD40 domain-containing protein n=1 Tax=Humisphaera borealis TaxID=2807512 RepID=A0A7M2WXV7_9BACT|nr:carbohydrate-binding domain-containing protein [Humisphaera borealis]QOV90052.1 PD40 domain-containing protein [Humisphaera borealis]
MNMSPGFRAIAVEPLERRRLMAADALLTWAAGLIVGDFGGSRGGIFVSRLDGSDMKQITTSQTDNFEFSGHGLNLPDDHPSFSPDGKQIVFTTSRFQDPGQTNNFELAIMNVDGTNIRRLTNSPGIDTEPVFSPDGSKIAFASDRAGNLDIWIMNADGTGLSRLTSAPEAENEPAWSRAGTRLAYTKILDGGVLGVFDAEKDIYIINADGTGNRLVAGLEAEEHDAVWGPGDTQLLITSEKEHTLPFGDVYKVNAATGAYGPNLTIDDSFLHIGGGGDPSWSPDGTKIAYFKAVGGPLLLAGPQKVFVMNANGSGKKKIDAPGIINVHPHIGNLADSDQDGKPDYIDINSPADFTEAMVQDEVRVRNFLGDLTILDSQVGVGRLLGKGYVPTHNFNSFNGMGVAFARDINNNDVSELGRPDVLLYAPKAGRDPTDAFADFPYTLISWGYGSDYDPATIPTFAGFPADAWLVHEAGFHHIVGGTFEPTPPANDVPRGSKVIHTPPDRLVPPPWHERIWDIHFFVNPSGGAPKAAIFDPFGRNIQGFSGASSFFFPQIPYNGKPIPGALVEAENFDMARDFGWKDNSAGNSAGQYRVTDVDIARSLDQATGFDVVGLQAGEFLRYTVNLASTGIHEFALRLSNGQAGGKFHVEIDGVNVSGTLNLPVTAGPKPDYQTVVLFSKSLTAGQHAVKVVFDVAPSGVGSSPRIDSFSLTRQSAPLAKMSPVHEIETITPGTSLTVLYRDNAAINAGMIDAQDIRVVGPGGVVVPVTLVSKSTPKNAVELLATYALAPKGGNWDPTDNGIYTVQLLGNQIADVTGVAIAPRILGTFEVAIPKVAADFDLRRGIRSLTVNGSDNRDVITVTELAGNVVVTINGSQAGPAFAKAGVGSVVINAGGGDDLVQATGLTIPVTIDGGDGNDDMTGGLAADVILGGAGKDIATAQPGDSLDLGAGQDGIVIQGTAAADDIFFTRRIGKDGPRVLVKFNGAQFLLDYKNGETITVHGNGGNDSIQAHDTGGWITSLFGDDGDDLIVGDGGNGSITGGRGHDTIDGRGGSDSIFARDGDRDHIFDDLLDSIRKDDKDRVYR